MNEKESNELAESTDRRTSLLYWFAAITVLYVGRRILIAVAMAILLTFVVVPLVAIIERVVRRRAIAVLLATLLVSAVLGGVIVLAGQQVAMLAEDLPTYRETIVRKIRSVQSGPGSILGRIATTVKQIGDDIAKPADPELDAGQEPAAQPPRLPFTQPRDLPHSGSPAPPGLFPTPAPNSPFQTAADTPSAASIGWRIFRSSAEPLEVAAIVVLLMVMMLISRENIRDRIIRLAGLNHVGFTTHTLEDTGARIGRYLRAQLLVNTIFGVVVSTGLLLLGVPNALLCGLLAGVLRFIPVLGPWLGALIPLVLALAVFDGWFHVAMVLLMFIALDIFNNAVFEPWLYGASTGLSSFGIILALVFWTWLWGPVGLILAVPMTVCVVVFTKQITHFSWLSILLSDEPALSEPMRFYQRLLCRNEDDAAAILAASPPDADPAAVLDEVVITSLSIARADLRQGLITGIQATHIATSASQIALEWLSERDISRPTIPSTTALTRPPGSLVCLPAHDALDAAAAAMLSAVLARAGLGDGLLSSSLLFSERIAAAEASGVAVVVVCSVGPPGELPLRRVRKALQRASASRTIIMFSRPEPVYNIAAPKQTITQTTTAATAALQTTATPTAATTVQALIPSAATSERQATTVREVVAIVQSIE